MTTKQPRTYHIGSGSNNGKTACGLDTKDVLLCHLPTCDDCLREELKDFATKHTPGPWETHPLLTAAESMLLFIESYGGEVTENYSASIPMVKAIIAKEKAKKDAAPELLEALKILAFNYRELIADHCHEKNISWDSLPLHLKTCHENATKAIAKAEGRG